MNPIIIGIVVLALLLVFPLVICILVWGVWRQQQREKPRSGLHKNVAGMLCYVLGWISGLVFILVERENKFVRFHAMQSIIVFGTLNIVIIVLGLIPVPILHIPLIYLLILLMGFVFWVLLMVKAYQGTKFKLPWSGNLAEKWAS